MALEARGACDPARHRTFQQDSQVFTKFGRGQMGARTRVKTRRTEASGLGSGPGCGVSSARASTRALCTVPLTADALQRPGTRWQLGAAGGAPSSVARSLRPGHVLAAVPSLPVWLAAALQGPALSRLPALPAPHRPVGVLGHMEVVACAVHLEAFKQAAFAPDRPTAFVPDTGGQQPGAIRDPYFWLVPRPCSSFPRWCVLHSASCKKSRRKPEGLSGGRGTAGSGCRAQRRVLVSGARPAPLRLPGGG